jgi:hypothetical protein
MSSRDSLVSLHLDGIDLSSASAWLLARFRLALLPPSDGALRASTVLHTLGLGSTRLATHQVLSLTYLKFRT